MSIEDLSKSQLLLLTILVNFVTSIATGILTVSLLDQVPKVVTQNINHVIEHTIETVAQAAPAAVIQAPQTSVEDLVTAAFSASEARSVLIYAAATGTSTDPLARGTYLSKSKVVVAVATASIPREALIVFRDGTALSASLIHLNPNLAIYGFADKAVLPNAPATTLVPAKDLKVGQTMLSFAKDKNAVTGIVARVGEDGIHSTLPDAAIGTTAVDLSGNIIGISDGTSGVFMSADLIRDLLTSTSTLPSTTSTP